MDASIAIIDLALLAFAMWWVDRERWEDAFVRHLEEQIRITSVKALKEHLAKSQQPRER